MEENKNKGFVCTHSNGTQYVFNQYRGINQFGGDSKKKKVDSKKKVLENAKRLYTIRNEIIDAFKDGTFLCLKNLLVVIKQKIIKQMNNQTLQICLN